MPSTMNINSRPSIHTTVENSEDEYRQDESLIEHNSEQESQTFAESGSDFDDNDDGHQTFSPEDQRRERFEMSRSVPRTPQRPKLKPHHDRGRSKTPYVPESAATSNNSGGSSSPILIFVLAVLVGLAGIGCLVFAKIQSKQCSYEKLKKQYPEQDEKLWISLQVGIESILNKLVNKPATYLFVHHGGGHIHNMVKDIASHSSSCFDQDMHPVEMESSDFTSSQTIDDYGYAIEKYKLKIRKGNVILIANLNEIPARAARAFHTICDTHSPIAADVVIFLTLIVPPSQQGNVESITEDTLIKLWGSELEDNELGPLITRVTDQVISLKS